MRITRPERPSVYSESADTIPAARIAIVRIAAQLAEQLVVLPQLVAIQLDAEPGAVGTAIAPSTYFILPPR
jgi:hypothetical protein